MSPRDAPEKILVLEPARQPASSGAQGAFGILRDHPTPEVEGDDAQPHETSIASMHHRELTMLGGALTRAALPLTVA